MKAVGVGSFWFAAKGGEPNDYDGFSPVDHLKSVQSALESIDSISNLKILGRGERLYVSGRSFSGGNEDENFFPLIGSVKIQFDIFLPERVQEKYSLGRGRDKGIETFHVKIAFERGLPAAFVYYDVTTSEADCGSYSPSTSVIIVREYLTEKLKDHQEIEFQFLGPSPFHADWFVETSNTDAATERDLSASRLGYRTLLFQFPVKEDELIDAFIEKYKRMIGAFYDLIRLRNRDLICEINIENNTRDLIARSRSSGRNIFRRWFGNGSVIDDVHQSILDQSLNTIAIGRFVASHMRDEIIHESSVLYHFFEENLKDETSPSTDDVKDILRMLEDRRQAYIRNTTTVVSGLIGGILGATLTYLLSSHSTHLSSKPEQATPASQLLTPTKQ
ncbi:hypothetical protein ACVJGC_008276 [Bradyrhizobium diazoefficiens]|uniref:hypothetical protein n=1 Tax=Bradyrhizobium diazoefficiens TaxID=1355477 RepID=UPI002729C650|nr:hypothetical protein [Bradyrhizobium diazoefficiens]WLA61023.1 hypothetical protein QIH81_20915 [Bradyrhizobium diazoefficiens]